MKKNVVDSTSRIFISLIGLVVVFYILKELQHIFIPFIIAYFLYFVFEPVNKKLQNKGMPNGACTLIDLSIVVGIIWGISRIIISSFNEFGDELPTYQIKLSLLISNIFKSIGISDPALTKFDLSEVFSSLDIGGLASGFFSSTLSLFSTVFFVLFFFIFISSGHSRIIQAIKNRYVSRNIKDTLKKLKKDMQLSDDDSEISKKELELGNIITDREKFIEETFKSITGKIQTYISAKILISLLTGVLVGIVLWIFGVKFFIVWAVLTFLLNFIPNIGSVMAVILPVLMSLVQFDSLGYTLIIAIIIIVIQNVIGNLIEPKIVGDKLGLNPLVILLSLLLWGYIWGIVGMFLSVPLTAVVKIIISNSRSENLTFLAQLMEN